MTSDRQLTDLRNLVNGLYTLGSTIGRGHFAVVKLARHIFTQRDVAVKVIDKMKLDEVSKAHLFQEVTCMKSVQHRNVVRLYEVIDTPNKLYLILELGDGGDMYDYIMKHVNGLSESLARTYFRQICRGLQYCHKKGVCHRDLKPENLVFFEKQGIVKLTDFGFSNKFLPGKKLLTSCGSLAYSAPEILLGDPYDAPAIDIWSLGVILFMLVTGRAPFQEANDSETVMMILDCSYKLPQTISSECQDLIHRMIVREPEKRATLDEVMSDSWYRQYEEEDDTQYHDNDVNPSSLASYKNLPLDNHQSILRQMVDGNIAEQETILKALDENEYNHLTATYYLLAEKIFTERTAESERPVKRSRRHLQASSDPLGEQIGTFLSASNFNSPDFSFPTTRQSSMDDLVDKTEDCDDAFGKDKSSSMLATSRHPTDPATDQLVPVDDSDERPSVLQQRAAAATTQSATPAQAMKIILEEDEYPESPPPDKTMLATLPLGTLPKLNKIVEKDEDEKLAKKDSSATSSLLRSKDLRSVVETKRRNFSRSRSSSDSEDNGSNNDMNRSFRRKRTHSPQSLQESGSIISASNTRGRSYSNIDPTSSSVPSHSQQSNSSIAKQRNSSRTSSLVSHNRLTFNGTNDEVNSPLSGANSFTVINDRTRSLSIEHRLANPSQLSIASRVSIRYSTPRESTVFTKTDAPIVVRLLQQAPHHDVNDAIRTIIEYERSRAQSTHEEEAMIVDNHLASSQPAINDTTSLSSVGKTIGNGQMPFNAEGAATEAELSTGNGHRSVVPSRSPSVLSTLKCSLVKHQQQRKSNAHELSGADRKDKHASTKHRACCTLL